MYDILDMESGETVLELGTQDDVKAFLNDIMIESDFNGVVIEDCVKIINNMGFKVYQID